MQAKSKQTGIAKLPSSDVEQVKLLSSEDNLTCRTASWELLKKICLHQSDAGYHTWRSLFKVFFSLWRPPGCSWGISNLMYSLVTHSMLYSAILSLFFDLNISFTVDSERQQTCPSSVQESKECPGRTKYPFSLVFRSGHQQSQKRERININSC